MGISVWMSCCFLQPGCMYNAIISVFNSRIPLFPFTSTIAWIVKPSLSYTPCWAPFPLPYPVSWQVGEILPVSYDSQDTFVCFFLHIDTNLDEILIVSCLVLFPFIFSLQMPLHCITRPICSEKVWVRAVCWCCATF